VGERRCAYRVYVGLTEGKRLLGRPWRRWKDNIKMNLQEVEWGHGLAQNSGRKQALMNVVTKLLLP
jgi:hypothetical protein